MNTNPTVSKGEALRQVSGASTGLLITGIIGGFFSLIGIIGMIIGAGLLSMIDYKEYWDEDWPEFASHLLEGSFSLGANILELAIAAFIIFAALKMRDLQQWGIAVAASVLAMVPCISPCCIIGLPIGIWCLVVLNRPEVRSAFD